MGTLRLRLLLACVGAACATAPRSLGTSRDDPFVHAIVGAMEEQDRRLGAALREYEAAVSADDHPYLWYKIGTLFLRLGEVERAAFALAKAVESAGAPLPWLRQAAAVQGLAGRMGDALKIHLHVLDAQPGDHRAALAAAKILMEMQMPDSAAGILLGMDPPWPAERAAAMERASLLLRAGRAGLASEFCDSARFDPGPEGRLFCARALAMDGRIDDAASAFRRVALENCEDEISRESFEGLLQLGRPDAAVEVATAASECSGRGGEWATRKAYALMVADRLAEADDLLHERLREQPQDLVARELLALVAHRKGLNGRAESILRQSLDVFPDAVSLRRRLAGLYQDTGRAGDAARVLIEGLGRAPDSSSVAAAQAALVGAGYPEWAVHIAHRASAASGDIAFQTAAAWERLACVRRSVSAFEDLVKQGPQQAQACNYLGYMLAERGFELARAETLVQCALALDPDNPYYLDSLGWVYFRQGRLHEAIEPLRRAMALDPEEAEVMKHLGSVLCATGQHEEGRALLRKAAEIRTWDLELLRMVEEDLP